MSKLMSYKKLMPAEKKSNGNETMIDLIYNFLNEPALRGLSDLAIGGTLPLSNFQLGKGSCAKQFWYCLDESQSSSNKRAFLAIEDSVNEWPRDRKESEIPTTPESEILYKPVSSFTFDDANFDRTDIAQVDQFIQQYKDTNLHTEAIRRNDVKQFGKAFMENFGGRKENREFCYYPLAYFENFTPETGQNVIDDFMKLGDIQYVRYHFGLETSEGHGANRIRVILFPVGKELTKIQSIKRTNDVLQMSWPPFTRNCFETESFELQRSGSNDQSLLFEIEDAVIE
jgi:hypothetical protein